MAMVYRKKNVIHRKTEWKIVRIRMFVNVPIPLCATSKCKQIPCHGKKQILAQFFFSVFAFSCVQCNVMSAIIVYIFLSQWHNWQLQGARAHSSRSGEFELKTIGHEYKQCVLCCLSFWVACATERMHTWLTNKANAGNFANRKKKTVRNRRGELPGAPLDWLWLWLDMWLMLFNWFMMRFYLIEFVHRH